MNHSLSKYREEIIVAWLGVFVFFALNYLMIHTPPHSWVKAYNGYWTAFHRHFEVSGYDPFTYIIVSKWRPLYVIMRHPLLAVFMYPLSSLNEWMMDTWHMNFSIYIVAGVWIILDVITWTLTYRIMRRILSLGVVGSMLMTLYFYSFGHVMLASFAPDHMVLSLFCLVVMFYLAATRKLKLWQSLLMCFVAGGITTTNTVKMWLIDMVNACKWGRVKDMASQLFRRSLWFIIPVGMLYGLYEYQQQTTMEDEMAYQDMMLKESLKKDKDGKIQKRNSIRQQNKKVRESHQIVDNELFEYTDNTIDVMPSLVHNIFGEGLILHEDYLLKDSNEHQRPIFVKYRHWWEYAVQAAVILLFVAGVWVGRRQRLLWVVMSVFIFDMVLHAVLRFALTDVYIMTAHWAFVIPLATAYCYRYIMDRYAMSKGKAIAINSLFALMVAYLWWHNASLLVDKYL